MANENWVYTNTFGVPKYEVYILAMLYLADKNGRSRSRKLLVTEAFGDKLRYGAKVHKASKSLEQKELIKQTSDWVNDGIHYRKVKFLSILEKGKEMAEKWLKE